MHCPLARDANLALVYHEFTCAYEQVGHMERVPDATLHHPQLDLAFILLNWHRYRYAFPADIVKMFRQIGRPNSLGRLL